MTSAEVIRIGLLLAIAGPAAMVVLLGATSFAHRVPGEGFVGRSTIAVTSVALIALSAAGLAYASAAAGPRHFTVLPVGGRGVFAVELFVDGRGLWFATLTAFICAIVATFAHRYMHREPGYTRYFVQFNLFVVGLLLIALAGSTTLLFAGWEFIGLSSALLVGFFHERREPVRNALRLFVVYRVSDAALFSAVLLLRHELGTTQLDALFERSAVGLLGTPAAAAIGALLVLAAAGKCAQLPFSGWIPRAMEGPTPSSAAYYGALSIHAGAFLLLRAGPLLETIPLLQAAVIALGGTTALFATVTGRVQTDVKSKLACASLTQVSIILVEIGLGWYDVALVHMTGHAIYRLAQILRSPSAIHDHHELANAAGHAPLPTAEPLARILPVGWRAALYGMALERFSLDAALDQWVVRPVVRLAALLDGAERRWCSLCANAASALSGLRQSKGSADG